MTKESDNPRPEGRRLILDPTAASASESEPAFVARPEGAPVYHGFVVLDGVEVEGFKFGLISEIGPGIDYGDAFVVAPDGSRAGLVWDVGEQLSIRQLRDLEPGRWGVWSVRFDQPLETEDDARACLASILPTLRPQWEAWRASQGDEPER